MTTVPSPTVPREAAPFRLRPRVARPASVARNVAKTLAQIAVMWTTFYWALPALVLALEEASGAAGWRFVAGDWGRVAAGMTFAMLGACGIGLGVMLAVRGSGTPLPFDTARTFVIAGPYRHVRNPMAMVSLGQGFAVALWHGSPLLFVYVGCGVLFWQFVARPWEEADLLARFGAMYARYRRRVRCWRVRLRPYDLARESEEPPIAEERTTPTGRWVVLYDGRCRFCIAASGRLVARGAQGTIVRRSFRDPGILDAFPGIPAEACERSMHLVAPDGRVTAGAEAVAQAVRTRGLAGSVALAYYVPGVRVLCDMAYELVARNRLRWFGVPKHTCQDGACRVPPRDEGGRPG